MALSLIKTGALAAALVAFSVSGAFAASWGTINYDTKVKKTWSSSSKTVGFAEEGDDVKIIDYTKKNGGWFKIDPPGPNNTGWVKKGAVSLEMDDEDSDDPNVKFCFYGPLGYVCVKS